MKDRELRILYEGVKRGEKNSIEKLLKMFEPLMYKKSLVDGQLDEDCLQELRIKLVQSINNFVFNPLDNL